MLEIHRNAYGPLPTDETLRRSSHLMQHYLCWQICDSANCPDQACGLPGMTHRSLPVSMVKQYSITTQPYLEGGSMRSRQSAHHLSSVISCAVATRRLCTCSVRLHEAQLVKDAGCAYEKRRPHYISKLLQCGLMSHSSNHSVDKSRHTDTTQTLSHQPAKRSVSAVLTEVTTTSICQCNVKDSGILSPPTPVGV